MPDLPTLADLAALHGPGEPDIDTDEIAEIADSYARMAADRGNALMAQRLGLVRDWALAQEREINRLTAAKREPNDLLFLGMVSEWTARDDRENNLTVPLPADAVGAIAEHVARPDRQVALGVISMPRPTP